MIPGGYETVLERHMKLLYTSTVTGRPGMRPKIVKQKMLRKRYAHAAVTAAHAPCAGSCSSFHCTQLLIGGAEVPYQTFEVKRYLWKYGHNC